MKFSDFMEWGKYFARPVMDAWEEFINLLTTLGLTPGGSGENEGGFPVWDDAEGEFRWSKWVEEADTGDFRPVGDDQMLGTIEHPVATLSIGREGSMEGVVHHNIDDGMDGIQVVGFKGDPAEASIPNAPIRVRGNVAVIDGDINVVNFQHDDIETYHECWVGPSVQTPDGQWVNQLVIGEEIVPSYSQEATSTADVQLLETEQLLLSLTADQDYAEPCTAAVHLEFEETGDKTTLFYLTLKKNSSVVWEAEYTLKGTTLEVNESGPMLDIPENGDVYDAYSRIIKVNPNSFGWVMGSLTTTSLKIAQGAGAVAAAASMQEVEPSNLIMPMGASRFYIEDNKFKVKIKTTAGVVRVVTLGIIAPPIP